MEMKNNALGTIFAVVVGVAIGYFLTGSNIKPTDQGATILTSKTADNALNRISCEPPLVADLTGNCVYPYGLESKTLLGEKEKRIVLDYNQQQSFDNIVREMQSFTESLQSFGLIDGGSAGDPPSIYFCGNAGGVPWPSTFNVTGYTNDGGVIYCAGGPIYGYGGI